MKRVATLALTAIAALSGCGGPAGQPATQESATVAEASEPTNEEVVAVLEEWAPEYAQHIQKLEVRNGYIHITYMDNREGDEWAGLGMVFVEPIRSEGWEVDTFEFAGPSGNIQNVYCSESRCATSKLNL